MNKKRPINLDLFSFRFPITAISSILHRVTGVFLVIGVPIILWLLSLALSSQAGFNEAAQTVGAGFGKFVFWAILASLSFHIIAGVRHLLMDAGIGESLEGGITGATIVLVLGAVSAAVIGVWLW